MCSERIWGGYLNWKDDLFRVPPLVNRSPLLQRSYLFLFHRLHPLRHNLLPAQRNTAAHIRLNDLCMPGELHLFPDNQQLCDTGNTGLCQLLMPGWCVVWHELYSAARGRERELHLPGWRAVRDKLPHPYRTRNTNLLMPDRYVEWYELRHADDTGHGQLFMPGRISGWNKLLSATDRCDGELHLSGWHAIRHDLHTTGNHAASNV